MDLLAERRRRSAAFSCSTSPLVAGEHSNRVCNLLLTTVTMFGLACAGSGASGDADGATAFAEVEEGKAARVDYAVVDKDDKTFVDVPKGALSSAATIRISRLEAEASEAEIPEGLTPISRLYYFEPHDAALFGDKQAKVCLACDAKASDVTILRLENEEDDDYEVFLDGQKCNGKRVCFDVSGFSGFLATVGGEAGESIADDSSADAGDDNDNGDDGTGEDEPATDAPCGDVPHGQSETRTMYSAAQMPYNQACASEAQTRTCQNGTFTAWSGTYTAASCATAPWWNAGHRAARNEVLAAARLNCSAPGSPPCTNRCSFRLLACYNDHITNLNDIELSNIASLPSPNIGYSSVMLQVCTARAQQIATACGPGSRISTYVPFNTPSTVTVVHQPATAPAPARRWTLAEP